MSVEGRTRIKSALSSMSFGDANLEREIRNGVFIRIFKNKGETGFVKKI